MSKTIDGRVAYADLLRVVAALAVVVLHLSGSQLSYVPLGSLEFHVLNTYDSLTRWCVPMFIMLSGMFLLDPKHALSPAKLAGHILRVLVALLVWGTAYALWDLVAANGMSLGAVLSAVRQVIWGKTAFHLWFLYMIVGLYLVTPILRAFVKGASRGDLHWFLLLCFLFASLLPTALRLRPSQTISLWNTNLSIHLVMGYVGYYVLGYYLKTYTLSRWAEYLIYLLGLAGAAFTLWGTFWLSVERGAFAQTLYNYDSPNIVFMSAAVFVFFRYVLGVSDERSRRQRVSGVAKVTFGIYLVHIFFLKILNILGITVLTFSPILAVPVLSAGVFLCSFAVAWLLSKLPLVGRYLT